MLETRITEMLGIKYPIVQGGMAWIGTAELVGALESVEESSLCKEAAE
jgi:nitronate monooxygenase